MNHINRLWKPLISKRRRRNGIIVYLKDGHDKELCASCANKGHCENPCSPLKWINGDKPLREKILEDPIDDYERPDYNIALYELSQQSMASDRIEEIIKVKDYRRRAICCMLAVQIPRANIAALLGMTRQHLYRLIESMLHQKGANTE